MVNKRGVPIGPTWLTRTLGSGHVNRIRDVFLTKKYDNCSKVRFTNLRVISIMVPTLLLSYSNIKTKNVCREVEHSHIPLPLTPSLSLYYLVSLAPGIELPLPCRAPQH